MKNINIYIFLFICLSTSFANNIKVKPIIFTIHSTNSKDWMYEKKPLTIFGFGVNSYIKNKNWRLDFDYIQLGLLGNVNQNIFSFSPQQSYAYLDKSKDADGYWTEYINTKLSYNYNNFIIELGKFDRHWGSAHRSLHISDKAPSYPQIGFKYRLNQNWNYIYFHGFLNSNIPDSNRAVYYQNNFSQRSINIPRNIAAHRIEWRPNNKLLLSFNESVIYATRSIDIHYLIPILPFYPIENYIGDTDNIQMGCDIVFDLTKSQRYYLGFFMDELTPEWIFKSKNHNWFGWQFGYTIKNLILDNTDLQLEYNWTDQRIYMHKYAINDFYSHHQPLGFWAGPHAQELLINYHISIGENNFTIHFSNTKRGINTREMVENNYLDKQNERFQLGYEERLMTSLILSKPSTIKNLNYTIEVNYVEFFNAGFNTINNQIYKGINIKKLSIEFGFFYNFSIKNEHN